MERKVFNGWVSREYSINDFIGFDVGNESMEISDVFRTKGNKKMWNIRDWPPKRVTITVEIED